MKCLITGAAGFIGSHLVEACAEKNLEIKAFVHYNSQNSWGWLEDTGCSGDFEVVAGDVRDYDSVYNAMAGCDGVFHLAALIGIPYSYLSPLAYIRTNSPGNGQPKPGAFDAASCLGLLPVPFLRDCDSRGLAESASLQILQRRRAAIYQEAAAEQHFAQQQPNKYGCGHPSFLLQVLCQS